MRKWIRNLILPAKIGAAPLIVLHLLGLAWAGSQGSFGAYFIFTLFALSAFLASPRSIRRKGWAMMALLAVVAIGLTVAAIQQDLTLPNGPDRGPAVFRFVTVLVLLVMFFEAIFNKLDMSRLTDRSNKDTSTSGAPLS